MKKDEQNLYTRLASIYMKIGVASFISVVISSIIIYLDARYRFYTLWPLYFFVGSMLVFGGVGLPLIAAAIFYRVMNRKKGD